MSNVVYWENSDDLTYNQPNSVKWPNPNNTILIKEKSSRSYTLFLSLFLSFLLDLFVIRILWNFIYNFFSTNIYIVFVK